MRSLSNSQFRNLIIDLIDVKNFWGNLIAIIDLIFPNKDLEKHKYLKVK